MNNDYAYQKTRNMKGSRIVMAIFKAFLAVAGIFTVGYFGYHYPDAMIYLVSIAVFSVFIWYFYVREEDKPS